MGARTTYPPGTFSWADHATADVSAARAFYGGVLGWRTDDVPAGGDGTGPVVARVGDDVVAGVAHATAHLLGTLEQPCWLSYVTVEDAAATLTRAEALGGAVVHAPTDVGSSGRTAVLRDPQGAMLALWQPGTRAGADRVNDVGCLCMNELVTTNVDAACGFYEGLFAWTTERADLGPGAPSGFALNAGRINASLFASTGAIRPHWRVCFTVASATRAAARVREHGGVIVVEPADIGDGTLVVVRDERGATFSVFAGETDA